MPNGWGGREGFLLSLTTLTLLGIYKTPDDPKGNQPSHLLHKNLE